MAESKITSIRIPEDLKQKLKVMAEKDNRSTNNLILLILQKWVKENYKEDE